MANILCVGIATLDIVNEVASYPDEDDEIRILSQEKRRGGNATNTAVILSQFGHQCYWAGILVNEVDSQTILEDLNQYQINQDYCLFMDQGKIPTSYITLSRDTGSRSICHYRDLPEYPFDAFKEIDLQQFDWLHFEGRNIDDTLKMMAYSQQKQPGIPISVEIEKDRENIESLISLANVILFSRQYALSQDFTHVEDFCMHQSSEHPDKTIICAWGESGAGAAFNQNYYWQDAAKVKAIDTLGAGDVFNAGIINHLIKHHSLEASLDNACDVAALKCTQKGLKFPDKYLKP